MIFETLRMKNYRQYRNAIISFAAPIGNTNFTIIEGENGEGKSNILNAITWCLYGTEVHLREKDKDKGLPIANTTAFSELSPGEIVEVVVELTVRDTDNSRIQIKREALFKKSKSGKTILEKHPDSQYGDGTYIVLLYQKGKDMVKHHDPRIRIEHLIPSSIKEYFFFDGEQLNVYFRDTSGDKIKESVFRISQIDLLEKTLRHLEGLRREYLKKKTPTPEISSLQQEIEAINLGLEKRGPTLDQKRGELSEVREKEAEYKTKLENADHVVVKNLEKERQELEKNSTTLEKLSRQLEADRLGSIIKHAPALFCMPAIKISQKLISEREDAGQLPPEYTKAFVDRLLKEETCICGYDLQEGSPARNRLEKLLNERDEMSNMSSEVIRLNATLTGIEKFSSSFKNKQTSILKNKKQVEENLVDNQKRLKEIEDQIKDSDQSDIKKWEERYEHYRELEDKINRGIGSLEDNLNRAQNLIRAKELLLKKEYEKDERNKKIKSQIDFIENALAVGNRIRDKIVNETRRDIEERTKKQFIKLIWKSETYKDVVIDEDYQISVVHQSGQNSISTLSAGERQVLVLSFIAALNTVSGFDVPIVIDTPLGNISGEPKRNIASNLPNYLEGKQVIMLVTDQEYTESVRAQLKERVGAEYKIDFNETLAEAKVETYG